MRLDSARYNAVDLALPRFGWVNSVPLGAKPESDSLDYAGEVKLLATFVPDQRGSHGSYRLAFLKEDAQTPFGVARNVRDVGALVKIIRKLGGEEEVALQVLRSWGQGSVWIDPNSRQVAWILAGE